ncbi:hypothetical protein BD310DRAFT_699314 [Dichomitus squalens]|uniref:Uncharacterized protein n=1 Tax=Dichomitus squalens TaxID=114155 RepID=A0A4Q9Q6X2_9APHY|nr:hypothetical protein BD310DRAFT_699314 [Dichomitus squalens]
MDQEKYPLPCDWRRRRHAHHVSTTQQPLTIGGRVIYMRGTEASHPPVSELGFGKETRMGITILLGVMGICIVGAAKSPQVLNYGDGQSPNRSSMRTYYAWTRAS